MHVFLESDTLEQQIMWRRRGDTIYLTGRDGTSYLLLRGAKAFVSRPLTSDTSFVWLYYGPTTTSPRRTEMFHTLRRFHDILRKQIIVKKETIHPFYQDNGICASIQKQQGVVLDIFTPTGKPVPLDSDYVTSARQYYTQPLLWVENVVWKTDRWYVNVKVVQMILYPQVIQVGKGICLLLTSPSEEDENYAPKALNAPKAPKALNALNAREVTYSEHPTYSKYFKMCAMGVPLMAVRMKLTRELGESHTSVLDKRPTDTCIIERVTVSKHPSYAKYFKMVSMGIHLQAVLQKMAMDGVADGERLLETADTMIDNVPVAVKSLHDSLLHIRLKPPTVATSSSKRHQTPPSSCPPSACPRISMEEIFKKRGEIMRKKSPTSHIPIGE